MNRKNVYDVALEVSGAILETPWYIDPYGNPVRYESLKVGDRLIIIGFGYSSDIYPALMDFGVKDRP